MKRCEGLYKKKYLIAVYDKDDNLVSVSGNAKLLSCAVRVALTRKLYKVYLIDVYEKHDDIFSFEDEIFLKEEQNNILTNKEKANKMGISLRTYQRRLKDEKIRNKIQ